MKTGLYEGKRKKEKRKIIRQRRKKEMRSESEKHIILINT